MPDCDACGLSLNGSVNFCPRCGAPQNEAARQRLDNYARRRAAKDDEGGGDDRRVLADRLSYVVGYVTVVVGLTIVSGLGTWLLVLGGVAILPPVGRLVGQVLDDAAGRRVRVALFAALVAAGVAVGQLL